MKKAGIVLLVLQVLTIFGSLTNGSSVFVILGPADIFKVLGFLLPGIIGVILIIKAGKKENKDKVASVCPKCGRKAQEGDVFCAYCGQSLKK